MNPIPIGVNAKPEARGVKPSPSCKNTDSRKNRPASVEKNRIAEWDPRGKRSLREEVDVYQRKSAACRFAPLINYKQDEEWQRERQEKDHPQRPPGSLTLYQREDKRSECHGNQRCAR